jgi:soluble lytic murein transglycosylase
MGMMQLMPNVARQLAKSQNFPLWDRALLFQPDVNVQLGVIHFAGLLRRYDHVEYALAAYNAGGSRVARWRTKSGAADPEIFVERIPYVETRDYVRIVLRNRALYRALYPSADPGAPLPD